MGLLSKLLGKGETQNQIGGVDDFRDELKAHPLPRNRMDLLWLDSPRLEVIRTSIGTQNQIFVDDGAGGATQVNVTIEDVDFAKEITAIVDKANVAGRLNNHGEAIRLYREALKRAPGCDMYLMSIGCSYANMGELKKGLAYLERAAEISPHNERIKRNLSGIRAMLQR
jgi:tetratricopeptide (TPR) repeat protein